VGQGSLELSFLIQITYGVSRYPTYNAHSLIVYVLRREGYSERQWFRYDLHRWRLQADDPELLVLQPLCSILPPKSEFWNVLPDDHVISSRHAGWGDWMDWSPLFFSVCQRHLISFLRRRHGHVLQTDPAHNLPGDTSKNFKGGWVNGLSPFMCLRAPN